MRISQRGSCGCNRNVGTHPLKGEEKMSLVHWIWFAEKRLSYRTEKALLEWRNDPANIFYAQSDELEKMGVAGEEL